MIKNYSLKKRVSLFVTSTLFKWVISLIGLTCRTRWFGLEHLEELKKKNQTWIYSIWHNNISFAALLLRNQRLITMVSSSSDGEFASRVLRRMGNETIRGSTSFGGAKVLLLMIKKIRNHYNGAITPDGPRGPKYTLRGGIVSIAQKSGSPLVPFHVESTRQWVFKKSWDKHKFPKPFSTIIVSIGKPCWIKKNLTGEEFEHSISLVESLMMENVQRTHDLLKTIKD